ncbi:hypothetical protein BCR35DRAFT_278795 [Leucosporidium creatinivorum]|uniref:GID complex catalytic subunit 2 n=1 Tax=Leucosporidium creatinivorum TaxID=106004 RepID=A0A1Y2FDR6_9BASI|nr:hypothetical protein BCR35DRAFT_278795 [Leucosporidium creatinivorum]
MSPAMEEYLSTLPSDLSLLSSRSTAASSLALDTVDSIIARLELARAQLTTPTQREGNPGDTLLPLSSFVRSGNTKVASANKEWSSAVTRFSKAVDKKFTGPPQPLFPSPPPPPSSTTPSHSSALDPSLLYLTSPSLATSTTSSSPSPTPSTAPFSTPHAITSLNSTIALHLARIGAFDSLDSFLSESETPALDQHLLEGLKELHAILKELRQGVCTRALQWVEEHPEHGGGTGAEGDDLEFALRKEEFIRLLLGGSDLSSSSSEMEPLLPSSPSKPSTLDPHVHQALAYGGQHFRRLHTPARKDLIAALLTSTIYMPFPRLLSSPYASLYSSYLTSPSDAGAGAIETSPLCATFAARFLETLGLPRDSALSVVSDIGGGGAMAKILKVRSVMKEKKTEWSAVGELPVEIPLPSTRRYHSIFACPVSKEQSTSTNPPMLLPCGHVIARESLARLARGTPQLKCPYCPHVGRVVDAVRVYF